MWRTSSEAFGGSDLDTLVLFLGVCLSGLAFLFVLVIRPSFVDTALCCAGLLLVSTNEKHIKEQKFVVNCSHQLYEITASHRLK